MLKKKGVRQHFVLGGDGTQKGAVFWVATRRWCVPWSYMYIYIYISIYIHLYPMTSAIAIHWLPPWPGCHGTCRSSGLEWCPDPPTARNPTDGGSHGDVEWGAWLIHDSSMTHPWHQDTPGIYVDYIDSTHPDSMTHPHSMTSGYTRYHQVALDSHLDAAPDAIEIYR